MLNNILTTTVNPIPMQLLELQNENALLSQKAVKLKKILSISAGVILIMSIVLIYKKTTYERDKN